MDNTNYELKNKGLHLVKADKENFWTLMDLRVTKAQEDFVASNAVSLAQAYDTLADGKFVQAFGIWDGETPVGFAMIGHNSEEYEEMAEVYRHSYCLWRFMIDQRYQNAATAGMLLSSCWTTSAAFLTERKRFGALPGSPIIRLLRSCITISAL